MSIGCIAKVVFVFIFKDCLPEIKHSLLNNLGHP